MADVKKIEELQKDISNMEKELAEAKKTLREMKTKGLREAMEASGVSENTKFNADTQNKLFDVYFKKNGIKIINTLQNEDEKQFTIDEINALGYDYSRSEYEFNPFAGWRRIL